MAPAGYAPESPMTMAPGPPPQPRGSLDSAADSARAPAKCDPQTWSCLMACNTTNGDCGNALNVCCAGIMVAIGECMNALTGCCGSCCTGCADCCAACCGGGCGCCS